MVSSLHNEPVVFFHVMKCGGTSVRNGLALGLTGQREGGECFELNGEAAKAAAAGKHADNQVLRALLAPGLWLQRLTTRQPSLEQLEVSIRALEEVLQREGLAGNRGERVEVMA